MTNELDVQREPFNHRFPEIMTLLESMRDTVLAGGAVRDYLTKKVINDFDFFTVNRPKEQFIKNLTKLGVEDIYHKVGLPSKLQEMVDKNIVSIEEAQGLLEDYDGMNYIDYVLEGVYKGFKVQFIVLTSTEFEPTEWIKDFQFGPSEVCITKEGKILLTEHFQMFLQKGYVITTKNLNGKHNKRPSYFAKMKVRYPASKFLWLFYE